MNPPEPKRSFGETQLPLKELSISKLDLDLRNSRFLQDASTQEEALLFMIQQAGKECLELLKDITTTGELNSSDIPIVVKNGDRFTVLEGNRRLTCLKLWKSIKVLANSKLGESNFRKTAERYISDSPYRPPTKIKVAIALNENEAKRWIDKKHGLGKDGASTVEWESFQKDRRIARFEPSKKSFSLAFYEFIKENYKEHEDIIQSLESLREKQYTILARILPNPIIHDHFGIIYSSGSITLRFGLDETLPVIKKLLVDLSSGLVTSRSLDKATDRDNYLNGLEEYWPEPIPKPYTHVATLDSADSKTARNPRAHDSLDLNKTEVQSTTRQSKHTIDQRNIFTDVPTSNFTKRIQRIVKQTSDLSVHNKTDVVAAMLRVILDITCYHFLHECKHNNIPNRLEQRIQAAILKLHPDAKQDLKQVEKTHPLSKIYHDTTPNSIQLVQYAVHDGNNTRTPSEVIILAERYEPLIKAMNDFLGKQTKP